MEEVWAEIPGTAGRYSVSNKGNVRSNWSDIPQRNLTHRIRIEKSKQLRPSEHTSGYMRIALGRGNHRYIHRLVAEVFHQNPENLPQVDHVDGNRKNNSSENLRWVSVRDNAIYGGNRHGWIQQKKASSIRRIYDSRKKEFVELLANGHSLRAIARMFGTSHSAIAAVIRRKD